MADSITTNWRTVASKMRMAAQADYGDLSIVLTPNDKGTEVSVLVQDFDAVKHQPPRGALEFVTTQLQAQHAGVKFVPSTFQRGAGLDAVTARSGDEHEPGRAAHVFQRSFQ